MENLLNEYHILKILHSNDNNFKGNCEKSSEDDKQLYKIIKLQILPKEAPAFFNLYMALEKDWPSKVQKSFQIFVKNRYRKWNRERC